jgi:acetolactate synthase small subunit
VLSSNPSIYIVELAGTESEIGEFMENIGACGEITEVVRSGVLGIEVAPRVLR